VEIVPVVLGGNVVSIKSQRQDQNPECLKAPSEWLESMNDSRRKMGPNFIPTRMLGRQVKDPVPTPDGEHSVY
jgi:hypothetical protein